MIIIDILAQLIIRNNMDTAKHLEHKIEENKLKFTLDGFGKYGLLKVEEGADRSLAEELLQKHNLDGMIVKTFGNAIMQNLGEEVPEEIIISENDLQFSVNLHEANIGFNIDQKLCREISKDQAINKNVLHLFGDTGVYSVYAASAGALTTTVSKDPRVKRNFELNNLDLETNEIWENDYYEYLKLAEETGTKFNLVVLDLRQDLIKDLEFDFKNEHARLIRRLQQKLLTEPGVIMLITDIEGFVLDSYIRPGADKLTKKTILPEYLDLKPHQSFVFYN